MITSVLDQHCLIRRPKVEMVLFLLGVVAKNTDLTNKTAIVTGGGRGIGEATAKAFARNGANVVVNDFGVSSEGEEPSSEPVDETVRDIKDAGGIAESHFGDVADMEYCEQLFSDTAKAYGSVDIVTNFAGILRDDFLVNMTEEDWDQVIRVHLKGHFALIRSAGRHWRQAYKASDGLKAEKSFIAVSSAAARGNPGQINYTAAKAGVLGIMRTGARELNRYGVRVNALMPVALTRLVQGIPDEQLPDVDEEELTPERVAPMAVFLGSDAAEGVTGCTFASGGDGIIYVTDPELRSAAYRDGGWTAENIAEKFPQITDSQETSKTEPGGLLDKLA